MTHPAPLQDSEPVENTDREIYRVPPSDYYADSIRVTKEGHIGIDVGGYVIVRPLRYWHFLAKREIATTRDIGLSPPDEGRQG